MAVIKKLTCSCGNVREVSTQVKPKEMPPCPICGSKNRTYDAKWTVRLELIDEQGRKYRYNKAYSVLKAEAVAHEAELKAAKNNGDRRGKDKPYTMEMAASFFETWLTSKMVDKSIAVGTIRMYRSRLNYRLLPHFKGVDIRNLTETDIEQFRTVLLTSDPPLARGTVNRAVATLKRITSLLYKRRMIQYDPLHGISMLKDDAVRDRVLTPEQIQAMLVECDRIEYSRNVPKGFYVYQRHLKIAVVIALNTGLRIDGVLTLRWSEISWDKGEIKKIVKGGKEVMIPITPTLHDALLEWREIQPNIGEYVIPSPFRLGLPMLITSNFGFKNMCHAVGIEDFTFHQLRHQFATYFISKTKNLPLAAKILGHSTTSITERYHHLVDDEAHKAMKGFTI